MAKEGKSTKANQRKRKSRNQYSKGRPENLRVLEREKEACRLRRDGLTLEEISAKLGYTTRSAAYYAIIRGITRLPPPKDVQDLRKEEIAHAEEIRRLALEQWQRSVDDAIKEVTKESLGDAKDGEANGGDRIQTEFSRTVEGQCGNPALLTVALKAAERKALLLGLDAPKKLEVENKGDIRVIGQNAAEIFEEAAKKAKGEVSRK
jgi:hypothetical protein